MKNCKPVLRVLAGALTFACIATAADAPKLRFKFTTINVKGSQSTSTFAINNDGVIVGIYNDSSGTLHGLKLVGGKATNIDDPKATQGTYCYGINSSGAIVGAYGTSSGSQGFLYQGGKFTDIGPAGTTYSEAGGINDKGEIVGDYVDSSGIEVGFLWNGKKSGKYKTLYRPGSVYTAAKGINNSGLITIQWGNMSGNSEAALYDGKKYIAINVPGAVSSVPLKIDTAGDVAMI
jgi:probable HAF family extracellular repeat protein